MQDMASSNHLLAVLRDRRIPLTRDDVQWAFESVKTHDEVVAWVQEYLEPNTLLSKEELDLYQLLRPNGTTLRDQRDLSEVRPIQDDDLRAAVEALEASTAAIDQQARELQLQKEALLALKAQNSEPDASLKRRQEERQRKNAQEKNQLGFSVEGLSDAINERITSAQKQTKASMTTLSSAAHDRLASDDRMLAALAKLSPKLETLNRDQEDPITIDDWCTSLVSLRAAEVRNRIDRVFKERLLNFNPNDPSERANEEAIAEKKALKEELETLHAEISSVAQMSVEQELRGPLLKMIDQSQGQQKKVKTRWLEYILSSLDYMNARLFALSTHARDINDYQSALNEMTSLFNDLKPPAAASRPRATTLRKPIKESDVQLSVATQQLLHRLDITLPTKDIQQTRHAVASVSLERQNRLHNHYETSQGATVQGVVDTVGKSDLEVHSILEALYSNSQYKRVCLSDSVLDKRIQELEDGIGEISSCMADLDKRMEVVAGQRMEMFIDRWGNE